MTGKSWWIGVRVCAFVTLQRCYWQLKITLIFLKNKVYCIYLKETALPLSLIYLSFEARKITLTNEYFYVCFVFFPEKPSSLWLLSNLFKLFIHYANIISLYDIIFLKRNFMVNTIENKSSNFVGIYVLIVWNIRTNLFSHKNMPNRNL